VSDLLCVTCAVLRHLREGQSPRRPNVPRVCDGCRAHLARMLAEIPDVLLRLSVSPTRGTGEIVTRAFESKAPLNLDALGDRAGIGLGSPLGRLDAWVRDWAEIRREQLPVPTLFAVTTWLSVRLDWACAQHDAVDEFAAELRQIRQALRRWQDEVDGEDAGRCPRRPGDHRCDTQLVVDAYQPVITCPRCGASWDRRKGDWLDLRSQQAQVAA
jgi:hypothetical protein